MTTTITVGTTGREYASIQAAWNALPATLADNYIFECYNDGELGAFTTVSSAKTVGAFTVTIKPAAGHGYRDHANKLTNPLRYNQANGVSFSASVPGSATFYINVANVTVQDVMIRNTGGGGAIWTTLPSTKVHRCILEAALNTIDGDTSTIAARIRGEAINNLVITKAPNGRGINGYDSSAVILGNTVVHLGATLSERAGIEIEYAQRQVAGNAVFGFAIPFSTLNGATYSASSDYNATDQSAIGTAQGTHNLVSLNYANQFQSITSGSEDFRPKAGSALIGAWIYNATVDPDIVGQTRHATAPTIGAFEYIANANNLTGSPSTQSSTSGTGAVSLQQGTLTSSPMKSWFTKLLRTNESNISIFVYDKTGSDSGDKVVKLTGEANDANAVWTSTSGTYVTGKTYRVIYKFSDGSEGMETVTAT